MNRVDLLRTKQLLIELKEILNKYGDNSISIQYNIVNSIIEIIDSDINIEEKISQVTRKYRNLYPASGGLSDFYIKCDNYQERLKLNKPLDDISDKLWEIFK